MKKVFIGIAVLVAAYAFAGEHLVGGTPTSANTFPFAGSISQMRWQTLWYQSEITEAGAVSKIEWQVYDTAGGAGGTWNDCKIYLCHTTVNAVTATFADNYGGFTPVLVYSGTYVMSPTSAGQWVTIVEPTNFTYNNTNNLLIEVSWPSHGTAGSTFFKYRSSGGTMPGRVYNTTDANAATGTVTASYHQYGRITIGYVDVAPTSLGRVKALYR